jgi:hypothetical protein
MIGRGSFTALCVATAVTGLAACGGQGDPAVPTVPSTAPAAAAGQGKPERVHQSANFPAKFQKRVNAKCKSAEQKIKSLDVRHYSPERFRSMRDTFESLATEFEQTKPPAPNERAWQKYTVVFRDGADWVGQVESEIADGDLDGLGRVTRAMKSLDGRMKKLSTRYGFTECADD